MSEAHIKIAAKLYECRDACKKLYKGGYKKEMQDYARYIHAYIKKNGGDEINAAIALASEVQGEYGGGTFTMKIMAAAVELIEPSTTKTNQ